MLSKTANEMKSLSGVLAKLLTSVNTKVTFIICLEIFNESKS